MQLSGVSYCETKGNMPAEDEAAGLHKAVSQTAAAGGSAPPEASTPPLSFKQWYAKQARRSDLLLLPLELLVMCAPHTAQLLRGVACNIIPSFAFGNLLEAPPSPSWLPGRFLSSPIQRARSIYTAFPCDKRPLNYLQGVFYAVRTGAVADPWVAALTYDYALSGVYSLIPFFIAAFIPRLYIHAAARHWLFFAASAATLIGCRATARSAPAELLPYLGAWYLSAGKRRMGAAYYGWRAVMVHRVRVGTGGECRSLTARSNRVTPGLWH